VYFGSGHCIPFKCPKALCAQENLTDKQIMAVKDNGGVIEKPVSGIFKQLQGSYDKGYYQSY